ncbi:hypothetical protein L7F22_003259 [Adiantum nelumboides]|nr:hypothetical protein [Adiantum nelumboides]
MAPAPTTAIPAHTPITQPPKAANSSLAEVAPEVLATVRCLAADLVQQFNGGHPGTAMGAAAIGLALWGDIMRFNPNNPNWLDRDRFVLSAGHACLLQYIYLHLCGYKTWTMDMLKRYHSRDFIGSQSAGHPEIEFEGVEVTTGPLGQGVANAVGLAMASKHFAARYNKEDCKVVNNKIYCMTGDGCIQEGIGCEALSMAGHLGLDNLILIYDNNRVTVDGNIDICFTEDTSAKVRAMGWEVIEVKDDATNDVQAILSALRKAKDSTSGRPVFINIWTTIGFASQNQGLAPTHGAALGEEDVEHVKRFHNRDEKAKLFTKISGLSSEFKQQFSGQLESKISANLLPTKDKLPSSAIPTRKASGIAVQALAPKMPQILAGSADLSGSTFVTWPSMEDFQPPSTGHGSYAGRQIRYGIREHAMAAIANGLAAYNQNAIVPVISTFFMFFLYAAPAIRMSALQGLRFVGIATHDSIDAEEVMGAWQFAMAEQNQKTPTILSLSRQNVPLLPNSSREGVYKGAYIVKTVGSSANASPNSISSLTLVATGGEVSRAIEAADELSQLIPNLPINVVSMPNQRLFDQQSKEYRQSVLPLHNGLVVAIEAWSSYGWARYSHASLSMHTFGLSGPQADLFEHFGFGIKSISNHIYHYYQNRIQSQTPIPSVGDFEELLLDVAATAHSH